MSRVAAVLVHFGTHALFVAICRYLALFGTIWHYSALTRPVALGGAAAMES
jgi:hypothetical protein